MPNKQRKERSLMGKWLLDLVAMGLLFGLACISAFVFNTDGKVLFGTGVAIMCLARKEVLEYIIDRVSKRSGK